MVRASKLGRRRSVPEKPSDQIAALVDLARGFDIDQIEAQIAGKIKAFTEGCLRGERCFDEKIGGVISGVALLASHLAFTHAFTKRSPIELSVSLGRYLMYESLHYRLLREKFKRERHTDLYGVMLEQFGFVTCAAIWIGAQKEARWLSEEYVRHIDAGYRCPYSLDREFQAFCRWLAAWNLGADPVGSAGKPETLGTYGVLLKSFAKPEHTGQIIDQVLGERTKNAYRRVVLEDESGDWFYGDLFPALFPFEILAFQRLFEKWSGQRVEISHPVIDHLRGLTFEMTEIWRDEFIRSAEARIGDLERESKGPGSNYSP